MGSGIRKCDENFHKNMENQREYPHTPYMARNYIQDAPKKVIP